MAGDARLFVLATLDRLGEAHGHEVVREAVTDRTENWAHVSQGALYSALRKAEAAGLVEPVRTEQIGKFPSRTVYRLTPDGQHTLEQSRRAAWYATGLAPDPFDLALSVSDGHSDIESLRAAIETRLNDYLETLKYLRTEYGLNHARLEPTALAVFEHVILRHETEVNWHRRLLDQVDTFSTPRPPTST
jgi:DNA-binding PadR family transcriptional regulator